MITPDNKTPIDDSDGQDADDQQSQQDVHSNGLDESELSEPNEANTDVLQQAYDAAESSYTLNLDDDSNTKKDDE